MHAKYSRALADSGSSAIEYYFLHSPMHPIPRSAADILASAAPARPARPKRSQKSKVDPFASDPHFSQFSVTETASTSGSTLSSIPVPFPNIPTETDTSVFYVSSSTFEFIPTSTPNTFLKAKGLDSEGKGRDSRIAGSGYLTPCLPLPFNFKPQMYFTYIVAQYHLKQKILNQNFLIENLPL